MLNVLRPAIARVAGPIASRLLRAGVSPDAVTFAGTVGVVAASLALLARGHFFTGTLLVTLFTLTDMLDGAMARQRATTSSFGAWLDSTCDRAADAAIFAALAWWFSGAGHDRTLAAVALFCLVTGGIVSYEKARAEGLGLTCNVGLAERSERLVVVLAGAGLVGLHAPVVVLAVALWLLAAATAYTVGQRAVEVHRRAALVR